MKKNYIIPLIALLLAVLTLSGCMNSSTIELIKVSDLQKMLNSGDKITLVDIREADTYNRGHIPGAINIPASKFEERYQELKPDDKIVLICYSGETSKSAAQFLLQKGYHNISSVDGGMDAWTGPVTK